MPDRPAQDGRVEAFASALVVAWEKYTHLFGEPPHGTVAQLQALVELMPRPAQDGERFVTCCRCGQSFVDNERVEVLSTGCVPSPYAHSDKDRCIQRLLSVLAATREAAGLDMIGDVRAFHEQFGVPVADRVGWPPPYRIVLRRSLHTEEMRELEQAICHSNSLPEVADAIADLIYVLIGTAHEFGIPLAAVWREVQAANMRKVGGATREDGKILKPDGWTPPDVAGVLDHAARPGRPDALPPKKVPATK
jgi:predicted HAD superfamily Cof-like phosphohydrolase